MSLLVDFYKQCFFIVYRLFSRNALILRHLQTKKTINYINNAFDFAYVLLSLYVRIYM